jgi:hypothetical protein
MLQNFPEHQQKPIMERLCRKVDLIQIKKTAIAGAEKKPV